MRLWGLFLLVGIGFVPRTWADAVVYYREADKAVVGTYESSGIVDVTVAGKQFDVGHGIAATRLARIPIGQVPEVNPDGTVRLVKAPEEEKPLEIPLSNFGGIAGGLAGAASLVIVARKKKGGE